jgi:hypothetical protein
MKILLKIIRCIVCKSFFLQFNKKNFILDWTNDRAKQTIIAFSPISEFEVRLPSGNNNLIVQIRDTLNCITEYNISSRINIQPDSVEPVDIINILKSLNNNPLVRLLSSGNQNIIGQVITLLSHELDKINNETINQAASG